MLCVQVFADSSFHATASSSPRRTISTMDDLRAEMELAKDGFARAEAAARAQTSAAAQAPQIRDTVQKARTQAAEAKTENLTRLRSATTAAAAAAPAAAPPPGRVATAIQNELKDRVGQHGLKQSLVDMGEAIDYEIEEGAETSFPPNMVLIGPPGTGKTTFVQRIFNGLAAGGVLKGNLVTINGTKDVPAQGQEKFLKSKLEEAGEGGVIFIDEIDQLTTSRPGFLSALLDAMANSHNRKIVFVIAHYPNSIDNFFNKADQGFKSRFDYVNKRGWHYLVKYTADELVQIAEIAMAGINPCPSFADAAAREAMMAVARSADGDARQVAEKAIASIKAAYSKRMGALRRTDREAHDSQRNKWTASDIFTACPSAASPPTGAAGSGAAAASTSSEAAAPPDASRTQRKRPCAPHAAAEAAAGGAPRRSSKSQASSSAAGAESSSARAPAAAPSDSDDEEEDAPLSNRPRLGPAPSKPTAPASSGKRKRGEAESGEARAEDELPAVSPEAICLAQEIVKRYDLDKNAHRMTALALVQDMAGRVPEALGAKLDGITRVARSVQTLLNDAFRVINAGEGKGDIVHLVEANQTQYVAGLRPKK